MRKRKVVRMVVEVSCPTWLTAAQARKEVRALINDQAFYGHPSPPDVAGWDEVDSHNFRAKSIRAAPTAAAPYRSPSYSKGR